MLAALQDSGLIINGKRRSSYAISNRVRRLASLSLDDEAIAVFSRTVLQDLCETVGETCYVCRIKGDFVESIAVSSPDESWAGFVLPGKKLEPHAAAGAKAIMAFQPDDVVSAALSRDRIAFTSFTRTKIPEILDEYRIVREEGFATCIKEISPELAACSVPVITRGNEVQFSVGALGPYSRMHGKIDGEMKGKLHRVAAALAALLDG